MHLPSEFLSGPVSSATAVLAAAGVGAAAVAAARGERRPDAATFAGVSALLFAAQMVNFPVQPGTSGHLVGGVLAAAVLGVPFGVLALSLVLSVQCFVFGDGGVSALGANIFNMALLGAGACGLLACSVGGGRPVPFARLAFAAWLSVLLGAFACCLQLAAAGTAPLSATLGPMLGIHAVIGLAEAALTVALYAVLSRTVRSPAHGRAWPVAVGAVVIAAVLAPFASPWPDGLEWAAGLLGFHHEGAAAFVAPMHDYQMAWIGSEFFSTLAAGVAGVAVTFGVCWLVARAWSLAGPAR